MNRNLRLLLVGVLCCLVMVIFTTGAYAKGPKGVPFTLTETGLAYVSGPTLHYPILDISVEADVDQPGPFGIIREVAQFQLDASTRVVSELCLVFMTAEGDVLYARGAGQLYPDPLAPEDPNRFQSVMTVNYIGGTGIFAGVRGTGTSTSRHGHLSPVLVTIEDAVITGTLIFPDSQPNMVPVRFAEGSLVGENVIEPESFPMIFQEITHKGLASHGCTYLNAKRVLLAFDPATFTLQNFTGFYIKTFASGDTLEGYLEGTATPSATAGLFDLNLQVWICAGTGRFVGATGYETGTGTAGLNGEENLKFEGMLSSVGSF